ncbi:MAG: sigma-70 family RNA polymerase sigma factor [Myxococcales bacterium]
MRPELYRYCRHLTRSPWDAEDLAQDTLSRAFVTLGQMNETPPNPRAWLFRVASNLWIDQVRRRRREQPWPELAEPAQDPLDPRGAREAAGTLLGQLSPQERAAVVLKDVFELSLEDVADTLTTSVGGIKAALHRARGKLAESPPREPGSPRPPALDAFCAAFNAGDLDRVAALCLDNVGVQVVGATTLHGRDEAKRTVLFGMLFGMAHVLSTDPDGWFAPFFQGVTAQPPRVEARLHRGEWVILHWHEHHDGEAVRALTRLEFEGDHVARLRNYFYNPELVTEVCAELGLPSRSNGYRWCGESSCP